MIEQNFGIEIWPDGPGKEGSEAAFERDVRNVLSEILSSRAGAVLAAALHYQTTHKKRPILLMPFDEDTCNAKEVEFPGQPEQPVVLFTPSRMSRCSDRGAASLPKEVLFHELVHAFRHLSGTQKFVLFKNGQLQPWDKQEEFLAVLITDIFISDATNHHKTALRQHHTSPHETLAPELADSFRFFSLGTRALNIIANFCVDNQGFAKMLATVPARFNPIAAYFKSADRAFEIAARGDADYVLDTMEPSIGYIQRPDGVRVRDMAFPNTPGVELHDL